MSPQVSGQTEAAWWRTSIIDIAPGDIRLRGYPIEQLVGNVSFIDAIWLMLRGDLPQVGEADLMTAALVAAVDHGPQAPSIAIARMSMTCGVGINNAMASAINALGDVHGGAGQQAMQIYAEIQDRIAGGEHLDDAASAVVAQRLEAGAFIEGFGHRFHPVDPRAPRLLALASEAADRGVINGRFIPIARAVERVLGERKGKLVAMNIDGATAVIYSELGFPPELGRGLFVLSRSVGILSHAWEQRLQGGRIKGPTPPAAGFTYEGVAARNLVG